MARVRAVVAGPTRGVPRRPDIVACEAETVAEVASQTGVGGLSPGTVVFVNGRDVRFIGGLECALGKGDVVAIVCPATDT